MSELKPCPFCGGTPRSFWGSDVNYVQCLACSADGPVADTEDEAIAAWNRRAEAGEGARREQ
jgi:Lar family restriction alleviation protein